MKPVKLTFRLEKNERNPGSCMALDATLSRQHTVTIVGDTAVVKSAGGIDDVAKQVSPGVYRTKLSVSGATLDIVFDVSTSPKTLSATEAKLGCKWSGAAS
jgi:hypothetical protein